jgi:hypothetical protein
VALALFTLVLEEMERAVPALLLLPSLATQKTRLVACSPARREAESTFRACFHGRGL